MTSKLRLSLACADYDRTRAIKDGHVQIEGVDLTYIPLRVEETFYRQLKFQEFDIAELSLSSYTLTLNEDNPPFVALPVFPSRYFRHQSIYVSKKANITSPSDLIGKRVGVPEYQLTAPVWQRGILEEHHGVPFDSVHYFAGNIEPAKEQRHEKIKLQLPDSVKITAIPPGNCLAQMLADGEIDAIYSASEPSTYRSSANVERLFPDFKDIEQSYYRKTKIMPIMHVLVVKRRLLQDHPWLARSITKAFAAALEYSYESIFDYSALRVMLPWLQDHIEECMRLFGGRWWQDGLKQNRHVLDKFLQYSYNQHLAKKRWQPEDLFALGADESFVV